MTKELAFPATPTQLLGSYRLLNSPVGTIIRQEGRTCWGIALKTGGKTCYTQGNRQYLSDKNIPMWIRHVLVPTVTDNEESLGRLRDFIQSLKTVKKVEILPYHTLGLFKWKKLGIKYKLEGIPTPTAEDIKKAKELLRA